MAYTILSAKYANEDNTAAIITTQEAGEVAISQADRPAEWAAMLAKPGLTIAPFVPPYDWSSARADAMPPVGDQLDEILKVFQKFRDDGNALPPGMNTIIDAWLAVKAQYPKPGE